MRLISAHVKNYRSVEDSGEFRVDAITCLVGKNEAGKTALLTALAALNPHASTPIRLDRERDYPRRYLTQYAERHGKEQAEVVRTTWRLEASDIEDIEAKLGVGVLASSDVVIARHYGDTGPRFGHSIRLGVAVEHFLSSFKLDAAERAPLKSATAPARLRELLEALPARSNKQEELLQKITAIGSATALMNAILLRRLPKIMYFSNYDRMDGAVQVERVQKLIANDQIDDDSHRGEKLFNDFFEYAGVSLDDLIEIDTYETFNAQLQAASNNITEQILEYWSQNPYLDVQVRVESAKSGDPSPLNSGTIARARVYNQLHRVDTPFSERSAGFVWFFSFLVKFAQVKDEGVPVILALDEPGLTLHGTAQADLLRFFKQKLEPHHQIIYSTHSPFMVPADNLLAARVVEDQVAFQGQRPVPLGTKVSEDVLSRDPDTLFPLQGALGYEITQTLFVGKNVLLLEGPSDVLYLQILSTALARLKRTHLDLSWTLCPVGGIGNVRPFVGLFGGSNLNVAVLADYAAGAKKEVERVRALEVLKQGRVLTVDQFTGKAESDIEDLFADDLYLEVVNGAYGLNGRAAITSKKLSAEGLASERVLQNVEAFLRVHAPANSAQFDHYRPAEYLMLNPSLLDPNDPRVSETLRRAEALFSELNKFL